MIGTDATRRELLRFGAMGAALGLLPDSGMGASAPDTKPKRAAPRGKAEACIMLWLGGGAAQIDTFDPKRRGDGKTKSGSYYDAIPTAIAGTQVCEHLPRTARRLDRCVLVRTLHHSITRSSTSMPQRRTSSTRGVRSAVRWSIRRWGRSWPMSADRGVTESQRMSSWDIRT
jgi:hypothetical protein